MKSLSLALLVTSLALTVGRPDTHDHTPLLIIDGSVGPMHPIPATPTGKSLFSLVSISGSATTHFNRIGTVLQMGNQPAHIDLHFQINESRSFKMIHALVRYTCQAAVVEKKYVATDALRSICPSNDVKDRLFCHGSAKTHHLSGLRMPISSDLPSSITQDCIAYDIDIELFGDREPLPLLRARFLANAPREIAGLDMVFDMDFKAAAQPELAEAVY